MPLFLAISLWLHRHPTHRTQSSDPVRIALEYWAFGIKWIGMFAFVLIVSGIALVDPAWSQTTFDCTTVTDVPQSNCEALVALYTATDGGNWTTSTGWLTDTTVGNWHGVSVGGGRITVLNLHDNGLAGTIPSGLGNLPNLQELYLSNNGLTGSIPSALGNLSSLQTLGLNNNNLSGAIPSSIANLSSLQELWLDFNALSGAIPSELGNLANLRELLIEGNAGLTGALPSSLTNLTLEYFFFQNTDLCEPPDADFQVWLGGIPNLNRTGVQCSGGSFCEMVTDVPQTECEALSEFYNTTGGDTWNLSTGWLSDTTVGNWHGVTVEGGGVTRLELAINNLSGTLTAALGNLTALRSLNLGTNSLAGSIPASLGQLTQATFVSLAANALTGSIPATLGNLDNVDLLALDQNQLSGTIPSELGNLASVTQIYLQQNALTGMLPDALGDLSTLEVLFVSDNPLSGALPTSLTNLALSGFNFGGTDLCEPPGASFQAWLDGIAILGRTGVQCSDGAVTCAMVTDVPQAECEALVALFNATNGETWIDNTGWLTDTTVDNWFRVTVENGRVVQVRLGNNGLTGTLPTEVGDLSSLLIFGIANNAVSGTIPSELGNLADLSHLYLYNNQLTGTIPPGLGNLTNLQDLRLSGNELSGTIPSGLGNLNNLEILDVGINALTGTIPTALGNLSSLQTLGLNNNNLSGAIPSSIANLSSLQELWLDFNALSGAIPSELGNLANLRELLIEGNAGLTGALPSSLTNLTLEYFFFQNTDLCEPPDADFQVWLGGIPNLNRTGVQCSGGAVTGTIFFRIDMTREITLGNVQAGQIIGVRGSLMPLGWEQTTALSDPEGDGVFEGQVGFTEVPGTTLEYKFVYGPANGSSVVYEDGVGPGQLGNRTIQFNGDAILPLVFWNNVTGVGTEATEIPTRFTLGGNYPNPFNPVTTLRYSVPHPGEVTVQVYDTIGRHVATLAEGRVAPGWHEVQFEARLLTSGLYLYAITFDGQRKVGRMSLLK